MTSSQYSVVILQTKTFKGVGEFFNFEIDLHAHEDDWANMIISRKMCNDCILVTWQSF